MLCVLVILDKGNWRYEFVSGNRSANYAIEGYYYQFDFSILSILNSDEITLEGIEDVDLKGQCVQVKYHSTQKYTPSKIKKPLLEFLKHYKKNQTIRYKLYAHFSDMSSFKPLGFDEIIKVIGKDKDALALDDEQIKRFVDSKFEYTQAKDILEQREAVYKALEDKLNASRKEVEEFYYPRALHAVIELSIKRTKDKRTISRTDFISAVDHKAVLFSHWLSILKGESSFIKYARTELVRYDAFQNVKNKFFLIRQDIIKSKRTKDVVAFCKTLIDMYYCLGTSLYNTIPLCFVLELDVDEIAKIRSELLNQGCHVHTGDEAYSFSYSFFNEVPIINRGKTLSRKASNIISRSSYVAKMISLASYNIYYNDLTKPDVLVIAGKDGDVPCEDIPKVFHLAETKDLDQLIDILSNR